MNEKLKLWIGTILIILVLLLLIYFALQKAVHINKPVLTDSTKGVRFVQINQSIDEPYPHPMPRGFIPIQNDTRNPGK